MLTNSKGSLWALAAASLFMLSACATQAPRVSNAALGYAVTTYAISADSDEENLSSALGSALAGVGIATAMPAKADISIDLVRYSSPIIGLFYGGQHYASFSVVLTDNSGSRISAFPLYVAANGARSSADAELANAASQIIAAKAATAFMPIKVMSKASPQPMVNPVEAQIITAPVETELEAATDDTAPCVIGPDGQCLVL